MTLVIKAIFGKFQIVLEQLVEFPESMQQIITSFYLNIRGV